MAKTASPASRLADGTFRLLAKQGWSELTLSSVARAAKVPLAEMHKIASSKPALIALMLDRIGEETARRHKPDAGSDDAQDRILDVALTWFETLSAKKAAMRALYEGLSRDPVALLAARVEFLRAAEWLLALAEADAGRSVTLRAAALAALLARTIPVWLEDDKEMSQTMARLDKGLKRMEWLF